MSHENRRLVDRDRGGGRDAVYRQDLDGQLVILRGGRVTIALDALRKALGLEAIAAQAAEAAAGVEVEPPPVFEGAGADGLVPDPGSEAGLYLKDDGTWDTPGGGGGGAPTTSAYVTIGNDGTLSAERALAVGSGLSLADGGANASVTLDRAALTGDVTAGAGSNATTIAADAVTNAKLANMAAATYKARVTAGAGDPEDIPLNGTAFPTSPAPIDGQVFYRTDLSCLFFYHATYAAWLSVNVYELDYGWASTVAASTYFYFFQGTGAARFTASNGHFFGFPTVVVGVTIRPSTPTTNLTAQVRANGSNVANAFVNTTGGGARNSKENIQTSAVIAADALISVFNTGSSGTGSTSGGGKIRLRRREV